MAVPKGFETSQSTATLMKISYPKFMRLHSSQIPSIQLHSRGPRLFRTDDVLRYIDQNKSKKEA